MRAHAARERRLIVDQGWCGLTLQGSGDLTSISYTLTTGTVRIEMLRSDFTESRTSSASHFWHQCFARASIGVFKKKPKFTPQKFIIENTNYYTNVWLNSTHNRDYSLREPGAHYLELRSVARRWLQLTDLGAWPQGFLYYLSNWVSKTVGINSVHNTSPEKTKLHLK